MLPKAEWPGTLSPTAPRRPPSGALAGLSFAGGTDVSDRLVLFLDYQNVYKGAREEFFSSGDFHTAGQVDPLRLGRHIAERNVTRAARLLHQVRIYTGQPSSERDPRGYGASRRQWAYWRSRGVHIATRQLRYPRGYPGMGLKPEEKGIDVQLAVDFVMMRLRDEYDVGIIFSGDTDLVPALEAVCQIAKERQLPMPEVCAWGQQGSSRPRLRVKGFALRCHWLSQPDYNSVADRTDYNIGRRDRTGHVAGE